MRTSAPRIAQIRSRPRIRPRFARPPRHALSLLFIVRIRMKQMAVHILCILIRHRIAFADPAETVHFQMRVHADRFADAILAQPSVVPQTVTVMRMRMRVL